MGFYSFGLAAKASMGVRDDNRVRVSIRVTGNAHDTNTAYQILPFSFSLDLRYICIAKIEVVSG